MTIITKLPLRALGRSTGPGSPGGTLPVDEIDMMTEWLAGVDLWLKILIGFAAATFLVLALVLAGYIIKWTFQALAKVFGAAGKATTKVIKGPRASPPAPPAETQKGTAHPETYHVRAGSVPQFCPYCGTPFEQVLQGRILSGLAAFCETCGARYEPAEPKSSRDLARDVLDADPGS